MIMVMIMIMDLEFVKKKKVRFGIVFIAGTWTGDVEGFSTVVEQNPTKGDGTRSFNKNGCCDCVFGFS